MRELQVFVDQHRVGSLREDNDLWVLTYDPEWARRDDGFDLSPALPRSTLEHRDGATVRQPPLSGGICFPPCQGGLVEALRPAWPSWMVRPSRPCR